MSMLDRFCDVKHTFEGKALAVFLSFVLAFSMVSIAAFADPAVVGGESDASDAQIDDAPADAAGAGAPAPEQPTATGPASSASQADDPQPQADASESSAPAPEADGPVAVLGVAVVGLEFSHAYLTYLDQAISLPADSLNVPLNKELVFAAHADEGCEIDAVKAIAAGVETVLEADEQTGEYKVPAEQVTSNLVLKLEASPAEADPSSSEAPAAQPLTSDTRIVDDEGRNEAAASGSEAPDAGDAVTVESDASEPAFEGYAQVDDVLVKVTAAAGILPEGTTVQAVRITSSAVIDAVEKAVEDHGKELDDIVAIDVTLLGPGGNVIQPDAAVNVCFFNAGISGDTLGVYHVANDGSSVSAVSARQADAVAQSFDVSHFSIYAVTAEGEPKLATYNFYDEDGALVETQIVKTGETLYEPELPEVAAGRFFQGWYAKSGNDWAEKFSAFGEQIVAETVTNDLYAKASEARYVYFMDDHGRVCTTKTGAEGDTVTADVTFPLAPNESVTGWYVDKELSHKVDSVTLEEDSVTLYPKVEHGSWMTFDAKGGSYTAPEFVSVGDVSVEPPEPMRAGYRFDGWYVDESYSGSSYRFGSTMGEDVTLHAKWKAAEANYSVVVWLEAADSTDEAPQYDYVTTLEYEGGTGETVPLPSAKDVKQRVDFTIDKKYVSDIDDGESDATVTIEGDGSSIANVRLNRVEFVIDLQCSTKKSSDKADYESAYQIKANYGADIAAQWSAATEAVNARYGTRVWVENPKKSGYDKQSGHSSVQDYD